MHSRSTVPALFLIVCGIGAVLSGFTIPEPSGVWTPAGEMTSARAGAAAVLLQDGRVLVTGGTAASGPTAHADLHAGGAGFVAVAPMTVARTQHTAVRLQDGRVLVAGGWSAEGATNSAELFDPVSNAWTAAGEMSQPRAGHTASLLADGRVVIAGGSDGHAASATIETFDPLTNSFTANVAIVSPRAEHAAVTLADGRVLLAGGADGATALASVDIVDPATGQVTQAQLSSPRARPSATRLLDGTVLVAGGRDGDHELASAEVFNPQTNQFALTGSMAAPRSGHLAFLLPDNNRVLIVGGTTAGAAAATAELFVPWIGEFRATGSVTQARTDAAGAALAEQGRLIVAGGANGQGALASAERYAFATLKTDADDYAPGQTVTITGEGWEPGETVTLLLQEAPHAQQHEDRTLIAVADEAGRIFHNEFAPEWHHIGVRFYLTATGAASEAQMTFTDAELVTTELVGATNDVTVTRGSSAAFTIRLSATGALKCTATLANPATATVRTQFAISAAGVLSSSTPSAPLAFFAGAPQGGPNCDTTWTGAPTAYSVAASVGTAATTPLGNYTITLSAAAGTTTVSTPGGSGGTLADANATSITVRVVAPSDSTPPVVTPTVTGTSGSNGWYVSDVTVSWSVTDPESTISSSTGCDTTVVTTDTTGTTLTCAATSTGGTTTQSVTVKRDASAPLAALSVTAGTSGSNGWYVSDVTVQTSGSDPTSGPVTCTADQQQTAETAGTPFNGSCTNDAGLVTNAAPLTVKLDKTGPSAALSVTAGTAGSNGWYTSDVTVHASGTDSIANPVTCTADQQQTAETAGAPFNGSCTNDAGLTTDAAPLTVKLDKTGPTGVASAVTAGTAGANGWYTSDVTVHTTGVETISGPADCTADQTVASETTGQSVTASCTNAAGLTTDAAPLLVKLDKTGPLATLSVTAGTPGANGWFTSDVTIHTSGSDTIASPVTCTADQQQTAETAGTPFSGSCTNDAGLTTTAAPLVVKVDKTAPSAVLAASGVAGLNGWFRGDVTITATGADTISAPVACTGPQYQTVDTPGSIFNGSCVNDAGLVAQAAPLTVRLDKTPPAIALLTPAHGGSYVLNAGVPASYACQDATSGPASCSGSVAVGDAVNTGTVGPHTFSVAASDLAGNSAVLTHTYHVIFATGACLGDPGRTVLQPINVDGTSVFKQKSTVPVKFRVCDANGLSIGANVVAGFALVQMTAGTTTSIVNEPVDSTTPDSTFRWDPSAQQWIFNTYTKSLSANRTYGYAILLTDGTTIQYQFGLK